LEKGKKSKAAAAAAVISKAHELAISNNNKAHGVTRISLSNLSS
jgi:hypothetical protein